VVHRFPLPSRWPRDCRNWPTQSAPPCELLRCSSSAGVCAIANGIKLLPVLWTSKPPGGFQPFVEWRRRQRCHQSKNRQPPEARCESPSVFAPPRPGVSLSMPKNKRGDGKKNVTLGQPVQHHRIFARLVEPLFYVRKVCRNRWIPSR